MSAVVVTAILLRSLTAAIVLTSLGGPSVFAIT
jgi:hypothetical protein